MLVALILASGSGQPFTPAAGPGIADPPAGFPDGAARLAYLERAVRFPSRLPPGPAVAAGFRLISARHAVAGFRSGAATGPPAGYRLRATALRLGTGAFLTNCGMRRLPVWLLGFRGVHGPAAVLAVAPAGIFSPSRPPSRRPLFVSSALAGPGGRALTVRFTGAAAGHGPCAAGSSLQVASSAIAAPDSVIGSSGLHHGRRLPVPGSIATVPLARGRRTDRCSVP